LQKRDIAKGRSAEMIRTTVLFMPLAFSLKTRVDLAQVGVSRLGTMLRTLRLPAKSARPTSFRSFVVRLKSGAEVPLEGSVPATLTGLPLRVTVAMRFSCCRVIEAMGNSFRQHPNRSRQKAPRPVCARNGRGRLRSWFPWYRPTGRCPVRGNDDSDPVRPRCTGYASDRQRARRESARTAQSRERLVLRTGAKRHSYPSVDPAKSADSCERRAPRAPIRWGQGWPYGSWRR